MEVINGAANELGASREAVTAESDPEPRMPSEEPLKSLPSAAASVPDDTACVETTPKEALEHPGLPKEAASAPRLSGHSTDPSSDVAGTNINPSNDVAATKTTTSGPTNQKREEGSSSPQGTTKYPNVLAAMTKDSGATGINAIVRKNIPPKKDRMEPLKLDMTTVMPLTSSQLSLQCLECHIIFSDDKSKRRHFKMNHPTEYEQYMLGDALFACYVCDQHFANSADLKSHQRTHTERKPFMCMFCGEAFKRLSHLTIHQKGHSTSEGYTCSDCDRSFKTVTLLKYHTRTHTGEKPYICKQCGKRFCMPQSLKKHLLSHTRDEGEENSNTTNETQKEKRPKSNDPSERKFSCPHCKARFKTETAGVRHLKRKHAASRNVPSSRALATQLPQNQGPPLLTPAAIGQSQVLQLATGGQTPQCIEPEQIKRMIESLGNVQKVNQLVIYGLEPVSCQSQTLNLQPVPGIVQPIRFDTAQTEPPVRSDTTTQTLVAEDRKTLSSEQAKQQAATPTPQQNGEHRKTNASSSAEKTQLADETQDHMGTVSSVTLQPQGVQYDQMATGAEQPVTVEETCAAVKTIMCESFNDADEVTTGAEHVETRQETEQIQTFQLQPSSSLIPTNELESDSSRMMSLHEEELQTQCRTQSDALSMVDTDSLLRTAEQAATVMAEEARSVTLVPAAREKKSKTNAGIVTEQEVGQAHQPKAHMGQVALNTSQSISEVKSSEEISVHTQPSTHESNVAKVTTNVAKPLKTKKKTAKKNSKTKPSNRTKSKKPVLDDALKRKKVHEGHLKKTAPNPPLQVMTSTAEEQARTEAHVLVKFGLGSKKGKLPKKDASAKTCKETEDGKPQGKSVLQQKRKAKEKNGKTQEAESEATSKVNSRKRKPKTVQIPVQSKGLTVKQGNMTPSPKKKKREQIPTPKTVKEASKIEDMKEGDLKSKQNSKEESPVSVIPDEVKSNALLLLKGHKQPQLKVHKLDAPQNMLQPELVPSPHTTSVVCNDKNHTAPVKENDDQRIQVAVSKTLKRQSSPNPVVPSASKKAKVGRKKKIRKSEVPTSSTLACEGGIKSSEGPAVPEGSSCERQKNVGGHDDASSLVRTSLTSQMAPSDLVGPKTFDLHVATDWDAESEMREFGLGDREDERLSFPALNPSPSLPPVPASVEGEKDGNSVLTVNSLETISSPDGSKSSPADACLESTPLHQTPSQFFSTSLTELACVAPPEKQSTAAVTLPKGKRGRKRKKKVLEIGDKMSKDKDSSDAIQIPDKVVEENVEEEDLPSDVNVVTVQEEEIQIISTGDEEALESSQTDGRLGCGGQAKAKRRGDKSNPECVSPEKMFEPVVFENLTEISAKKKSFTNPTEMKEQDAAKMAFAEARKCESKRKAAVRGRRKGGGGRGRRGTSRKRNTGSRPSAEQEHISSDDSECQIVWEVYPVAGGSGITKPQGEKEPLIRTDPSSQSDRAESQEYSSEEQIVSELGSVTTSVVEMKSEVELHSQDRTQGSLPGLTLEHFLTSRGSGSTELAACNQVVADDETNVQDSGANAHHEAPTLPAMGQPGAVTVKEEALSPVMPPVLLSLEPSDASGPLLSNPLPPEEEEEEQQGIRMFVVKEEDPLILNEAQGSPDPQTGMRKDGSPLTSSVAATVPPVDTGERNMSGGEREEAASTTHQPSAQQCIFFPVKEEDRELLLDSPCGGENQNNLRLEECGGIRELPQPDAQHVDIGLNRQDESGDKPNTTDLAEFLSQTSDTENSEFFDNEPEEETLALASYYGNRSSGSAIQPAAPSSPPDGRTSQPLQNGNTSQNCQRKPIDYFTQYFDWKTWQDVANMTAKASKMPNPVTAKEVSQFVGIHIAMGSLQFPSTKLYWEELTRVPLIADAMPWPRFLELLSKLRLAEEGGGPAGDHGRGNAITGVGDTRADPLHRVRMVLEKVQRACRNLKRGGNHGVDQYPLPLLGSAAKSAHSLHHTVLLSTAGVVVDFSLGLDDSDREDTVKKMVLSADKGAEGTVFLCRPELSIPSMLEQLLDAGVPSAGKVVGARGQVGDEFVSSDGKLKLFRCHHGFILSAVAKEWPQSRPTSLVSGLDRALRAAKLNRDLRSSYRTPCLSASPAAWPLSVLWHLMDLVLVNSWLERQSETSPTQAPSSLMAFRLEVSKALILSSSADVQDATPPQPPAPQRTEQGAIPGSSSLFDAPLPDAAIRYDGLGHWPEQVAEGEGARCRFGGCDRTSQVRCLKCCVFLCISRNHNCFLKFHNQGAV